MTPGAFSGVAMTRGHRHGKLWFAGVHSVQPLPPAVFTHETHRWQQGEPGTHPVAIAVPRVAGDVLRVDAVVASGAVTAWNKITHRVSTALSVVAEGDDEDFTLSRGGGIEAAGWTLLAVDLVPFGADPGARVTEVRYELTDAEREVQQRLDAFIADPDGLLGVDLLHRARVVGVSAMDALAEVVEPLSAVGAR